MTDFTQLMEKGIIDVMKEYPKIGELLDSHGIGCTKCKVGICKLKDVVRIHYLPKEKETVIFREIEKIVKHGG